MASFIDDDPEVSGQDSGDDSDQLDDNYYQVDRRKDNKNVIYDEDYVRKQGKKRKIVNSKSIEEKKNYLELELPAYNEYFERTVSHIKMWLPTDPFQDPIRHVEVQEDNLIIHSIDELVLAFKLY
jgi:hypothetical protein